MTDDIATAFRATRYCVALDSRWLTLAIDAPCPPALVPWLRQHAGETPAWLITAHNPGAQRVSPENNDARSSVLQAWSRVHARACLETVNQDPAGDWPDEPGLLLAGLEEGLARSIARRFGQLAMVAVRAEGESELVWVDVCA